MRERTKFYSKEADLSFLHDALGKEVLPEEYGGTNGTMKMHVGKNCNLVTARLLGTTRLLETSE